MPTDRGVVDYAGTPDVVAKNEAAYKKYGNQLSPFPEIIQPQFGATAVTTSNKKAISSYKNADGTITVVYDDGTTEITGTPDKLSDDSARKDAFALLIDTFKQYGLDSLADTIKGYMTQNIGPNEATLLLKQTQAYKDRFAGNGTRVAAGKNAIGESTYLALENQYAEVLKAYGQNALGNRAEYATLIGNDISNIELGDRLKLAVTRVQQSDPSVKAQLKQFYPSITDADLVSYFLKPDQTLPGLERKVTSAEIGAAATSQGLNTSATSAEDLAAFGVDRSTALKGYSTIGTILPEGQKLSSIYGEAKIDYTQATAEQEVFKGNASAERKRKQLAALETAQFGGSAGVGTAGLSTTYLRKSSSGGQF